MNLCKVVFQKDIYELRLDDITKFFTIEQEETSILEFKSGEVSLEAIHRIVAGFLNIEDRF